MVSFKSHGPTVRYLCLASWQIKAGRIARTITVYDRLALSRQLVERQVDRWVVRRLTQYLESGLVWPAD